MEEAQAYDDLIERTCAKIRTKFPHATFAFCLHPTQRGAIIDAYASRSALEGERKQVTVLFADLKGSMELLADRDPEEVRQLLDPVLERMMAAVHRYEDTVNQVMGDGIMALFGAPLAHEDHALRGEVWNQALAYCRQAGEKAMARSAYREAVGVLRAGAQRPPTSAGAT